MVEIIVNDKKIEVLSCTWVTRHIKNFGRLWHDTTIDFDIFNIVIDREYVKDLLYFIFEKNEHKIEYMGKVANFYITNETLKKLLEELKNNKNKSFRIEFIGTNTLVGDGYEQ